MGLTLHTLYNTYTALTCVRYRNVPVWLHL